MSAPGKLPPAFLPLFAAYPVLFIAGANPGQAQFTTVLAVVLAAVAAAALITAAFAASASFAADPAAGKKVAQGTCAVCHGLDGIAKNPDAPHLAGENVEYLMRQLKAFASRE